jgi:hypothetical protein
MGYSQLSSPLNGTNDLSLCLLLYIDQGERFFNGTDLVVSLDNYEAGTM